MKLLKLNVEDVKPNPFQPRDKFDEEKLNELADNIKAHGLIEPIVVTKMKDSDTKYTIVAGERRWRASKIAQIKEIYAIHKEYANDSDIKRDSLVENEIRENLTNKEFREFCESLAKSLGTPYWTKDGINAYQVTKYVLCGTVQQDGRSEELRNSGFFTRLDRLTYTDKHGVKELKEAVDENKIGLNTAKKIASIPDPQTQRELTTLAAAKDHKELANELQRHNIQTQYEDLLDKDKKRDKKPLVHEEKVVLKILERMTKWEAQFDALIKVVEQDEKYLGKFQHENKLRILDGMKPISKKSIKFNELMDKTLKKLAA